MDRVHPTESGLLADALVAAGQHLPMPCGSRHTCGRCGIYVAGPVQPAGEVEAALLARAKPAPLPGYSFRLPCLARIDGEVTIVASSISGIVVADVGDELVSYDGDEPDSYGLAIDVGTTTVTVMLLRLGDGERLADISALNHQVVHGSDVLSRIDAADQVGVGTLQQLIVDQLDEMIGEALGQARARSSQVTRMTITGNTTMLHLLTGCEVTSLGVYPFTAVTLFGEAEPASKLFPALTRAELYLPPGFSTYVGPDIVCGVLATGLGAGGRAELLIDAGTNGEMVLASGGKLWCCSTAAGPAFEGAEISEGMPALPGAIDGVWVQGDRVRYSTIGHRRAKGICGTGLIGAVDAYLDTGAIEPSGFVEDGEIRVSTSGISLTQADIRKLQLAKAAIAGGVDTLLHESGLAAEQLQAVHLAGAFGSYLQPRPAAGIGLIPPAVVEKTEPAGNTALTGAVLLTLSRAARRVAAQRSREALEVDLGSSPVFMERYVDSMAFRGESDG